MGKLVEVEHYRSDGSVRRFRMTRKKWDVYATRLPALETDFYIVYGDLKKRWDGCKQMTLKESITPGGFAIEWREIGVGCHRSVAPVLVPLDE